MGRTIDNESLLYTLDITLNMLEEVLEKVDGTDEKYKEMIDEIRKFVYIVRPPEEREN